MTSKQENFISMVRAVNKVLADHQSRWEGVKRFVVSTLQVNDILALMNTVGAKANSPIEGATMDKHAIEKEAIKAGVKIANSARVYARDKKNMELHEKLVFSESKLLNIHEDECFKRLSDVHEQLLPVVADLEDYGILNADLVHFKHLIDAYENALATPRHLTTERKTMNVSLLPELIDNMRTVLEDMDNMIVLFAGTPFPTEYENARQVIDLGSRRKPPKPPKPEPPKTELPSGEIPNVEPPVA